MAAHHPGPPQDADALAITGEPATTSGPEPEVNGLVAARSQRATVTGALYGAAVLARGTSVMRRALRPSRMTGLVTVNLRRYVGRRCLTTCVYTPSVLVRTGVAAETGLGRGPCLSTDLDAVGHQLHLAALRRRGIAARVLPRHQADRRCRSNQRRDGGPSDRFPVLRLANCRRAPGGADPGRPVGRAGRWMAVPISFATAPDQRRHGGQGRRPHRRDADAGSRSSLGSPTDLRPRPRSVVTPRAPSALMPPPSG